MFDTQVWNYVLSFNGQVIWLTLSGWDCKALDQIYTQKTLILGFSITRPFKVSLLTSPVVGRYLLCPGHLSVPATGCRLTKRMPDSATHENTEGLQHSNAGPVLLLLQCHFGARPKAGPAPSQSVSFNPVCPNQSMSPEISAVDLLTPRRVVWPINESRNVYFLTEAICWN